MTYMSVRPHRQVMTRKPVRLGACALSHRGWSTVAIALALTALLTVTVAGTAMAQSVSANGDTTNPGGQVTVTANAQNVTSVAMNNVPASWTVDSSQTNGGSLIRGGSGNIVISYATAGQQSSVNISVTFDIPSNASAGDNGIEVVASGTESEEAATATVTVQQTGGDRGGETNETDTEEGGTDGEANGGEAGGGETDGEANGEETGGEEPSAEEGDGQGMPGFGVLVALAALACYYAAQRSQS